MGTLAACGLIYEYLLSHYAGRVLGTLETTLFAMIGIMIVAMGIGAFSARLIKCEFTGFAWLEVSIALLGSSAVMMIAVIMAYTTLLPRLLSDTFGLPPDLIPRGGFFADLERLSSFFPYLIGFILGLLIGMEIPLIARVRETLYGEHLKHNAGSIYGADYIGAGIGAAIWVSLLLSIDISLAAALTASLNLIAGALFLILYFPRIHRRYSLLFCHLLAVFIVALIAIYGSDWDKTLEDMLYQDKLVFSQNTPFQHVTITQRIMDPKLPPVYTFYINGRTQFSSNDEQMYHAMLVYPTLLSSARHDNILIIGGGDGLALRDVLRWNPAQVTLIDLDQDIITLFKDPLEVDGQIINQRLLSLNQSAFNNSRVKVIIGDAFLAIDPLIQQQQHFDSIIVDLPDPSHPDLNKLYSTRFYAKLRTLLSGDGAISIQSTSPYHARNAFLSIGKTVKHAGFENVEQYHHNVPSFGEWGWTIATLNGLSARQRIQAINHLPIDDGWTTQGKLLAAFEFSKRFFEDIEKIKVNRLGSHVLYQYHQQDWETQQGLYNPTH